MTTHEVKRIDHRTRCISLTALWELLLASFLLAFVVSGLLATGYFSLFVLDSSLFAMVSLSAIVLCVWVIAVNYFEIDFDFIGMWKQIINTHHTYGWEYVADGSCKQVETCARCGHKTGTTRDAPHQFDEFEYEADGSCKGARVCRRCRSREPYTSEKHIWEPGEYISSYSCETVTVCTRCGSHNKQGLIRHDLTDWEDLDEFTWRRHCARPNCDYEEVFEDRSSDWRHDVSYYS